MRISSIDNTVFTSNKQVTPEFIRKISGDKSFTDLKPIKNYYQYLREYGLLGHVKSQKVTKKGTV